MRLCSNVKLQMTFEKPTEYRICLLFNAFIRPLIETLQKIIGKFEFGWFWFPTHQGHFEVILKQNSATPFKIAYCIASLFVFECFASHKLQEKRQTGKI